MTVSNASGAEAVRLSPRQRQVLLLVGRGYTDEEIGRELGISTRTARMHCDAVKAKLHLKRRRDLLRLLVVRLPDIVSKLD